MVETRYDVARRDFRRFIEGGRPHGAVRTLHHGSLRRGLHNKRPRRGSHRGSGDDRDPVRGLANSTSAWWSSSAARAASLFLEKCQMGPQTPLHGKGSARLLGVVWLSQLWRPLERAAI